MSSVSFAYLRPAVEPTANTDLVVRRNDLRAVLGNLARQVSTATELPEQRRVEMASSGVAALDALTGGIPRGAITEICGAASSGRTSVMMAALAAATAREETCALIDTTDSFDPEVAHAAGVNLRRVLWIRCNGVLPKKEGEAA